MTGGRRALVVDDEEPLARLVADYLVRDGFTVDVVADGEAAVEAARRERPDLIVLDQMLPSIDSVEACRRIRTFSDACIVMLTARAEEIDVLIGLSIGAGDHITKAFSPRELIARTHAMQRWPRTARAALRRSGRASSRRASSRANRLRAMPLVASCSSRLTATLRIRRPAPS